MLRRFWTLSHLISCRVVPDIPGICRELKGCSRKFGEHRSQKLRCFVTEACERFVTATKQALAVVALVAIAHGAAGMIRTVSFGWGDPVIGSLFGVLGEISFFLGASLVIYLLGKFVFGAKATYAQVLRPFGFSVVPGLLIVIAALASLPEIFGDQAPVLILLIAWRLAAGYVAVWQALSLGTLRSIVILLAGALSGMWAVVTATSILFDILP